MSVAAPHADLDAVGAGNCPADRWVGPIYDPAMSAAPQPSSKKGVPDPDWLASLPSVQRAARAARLDATVEAALRSAPSSPAGRSPWARTPSRLAAVLVLSLVGVLAVVLLRPTTGPAMPAGPTAGGEAGGLKGDGASADPIRVALDRLAEDPEDPERLAALREHVRRAILEGRAITEFQELQAHAADLGLDVDLIELHAEFHGGGMDRGVG